MRTITALSLTRPTDTRQSAPEHRGEPWKDRAACAQIPITPTWDPWFPGEGNTVSSTYMEARPICQACPVRQMCLDEAMREERDMPENGRQGMRGGMTPSERKMLAAGIQPAARGKSKRATKAELQERREVIRELADQGKGVAEIARELGLPRTTVHSTLRLGRAS